MLFSYRFFETISEVTQSRLHSNSHASSCSSTHHSRICHRLRASERDLDWEPDTKPGLVTSPLRMASGQGYGLPPPPPPPPHKVSWYEWPFISRRNIALSLLGGSAGLWLMKHNLGPIKFEEQPPSDFPFQLLEYTDLNRDDFVFFKTQGGNWVAAAEDSEKRLFMIDQVGDLYYDSGDPDIGLYAVDTEGNVFNFYNDLDGERKITPVGNARDLKKFKVNEIAGIKLDKEVTVVAFEDGSEIPLPPSSGYIDSKGKFSPPGELIEGYTRSVDDSPISRLFGRRDAAYSSPERMELDLEDSTPFRKQLWDQVLLDDPDIPGFQPALPDDFDIEALAKEVEKEAKTK